MTPSSPGHQRARDHVDPAAVRLQRRALLAVVGQRLALVPGQEAAVAAHHAPPRGRRRRTWPSRCRPAADRPRRATRRRRRTPSPGRAGSGPRRRTPAPRTEAVRVVWLTSITPVEVIRRAAGNPLVGRSTTVAALAGRQGLSSLCPARRNTTTRAEDRWTVAGEPGTASPARPGPVEAATPAVGLPSAGAGGPGTPRMSGPEDSSRARRPAAGQSRAARPAGPVIDEPPEPRRIRRPADLLRAAASFVFMLLFFVIGMVAGGTTRGAESDISKLSADQKLPLGLVLAVTSMLLAVVPIVLAIDRLYRRDTRRVVDSVLAAAMAYLARGRAERDRLLAAHAEDHPRRADAADQRRRRHRGVPHLPDDRRGVSDDHRVLQPAQLPDRDLDRADRLRRGHPDPGRRDDHQPGRDRAAGPAGGLRLALGPRGDQRPAHRRGGPSSAVRRPGWTRCRAAGCRTPRTCGATWWPPPGTATSTRSCWTGTSRPRAWSTGSTAGPGCAARRSAATC